MSEPPKYPLVVCPTCKYSGGWLTGELIRADFTKIKDDRAIAILVDQRNTALVCAVDALHELDRILSTGDTHASREIVQNLWTMLRETDFGGLLNKLTIDFK